MSRRLLGAALVAFVLAGCGSHAAPTAVITPVEASAPAAAPQAATGRLEIAVAGLGSGYRVQATVAEVKYLRVTLSGGALATPVTKDVSTAALAAGKGTVAFEAVPSGSVDVAITALDGAGLTLGSKTTKATVTPGQTAVVAATLKLNATHVTSTAGGLQFDLTLQDGDVVTDPIATVAPRPDSPVLSPAPSPLPTIAPEITLVGALEKTWNSDGTITVAGTFKNNYSVTQRVTLTVTYTAKTLFGGTKTVETVSRTFEVVPSKASRAFSVSSTKKVSSWRGDGEANVTFKVGS